MYFEKRHKGKMAEYNGIASAEEDYGDEVYQEPFPSEAFSPPNQASVDDEVGVDVDDDAQDVMEVPQESPGGDVIPQEEGEIPAEDPAAAEMPEAVEEPENKEKKGELEKEKVVKPKVVMDKNHRPGPLSEGQKKGYRLFQKPEGTVVNGNSLN